MKKVSKQKDIIKFLPPTNKNNKIKGKLKSFISFFQQ